MSYEFEKLFDAAVALPEAERAVLVIKLVDSIGGDPTILSAQGRESVSRLVALETGELDAIDNDETLRPIHD
jgi:hypothetical protein